MYGVCYIPLEDSSLMNFGPMFCLLGETVGTVQRGDTLISLAAGAPLTCTGDVIVM